MASGRPRAVAAGHSDAAAPPQTRRAAQLTPSPRAQIATMKTVLALAAGASALVAPAAPKAQRTVVKALDTELGVLPPLGFFDPLGLAARARPRTSSAAASRSSSTAASRWPASPTTSRPELYKFPGYLSPTNDLKFEDVPNGLNALPAVPGLGWFR